MKLRSLTLVELLITVSIFAVLTVVSIPLITQNRSLQAAQNDAALVREYVLKAKNLAQNPENEAATAYQVRSLTPSQLEIDRIVNEQVQTFNDTLLLGRSSVNEFEPIIFNVPSGEVDESKLSNPTIIYVNSLDGKNTKRILVQYPGVVNEI